jgi:hypothetical protein
MTKCNDGITIAEAVYSSWTREVVANVPVLQEDDDENSYLYFFLS